MVCLEIQENSVRTICHISGLVHWRIMLMPGALPSIIGEGKL